ncbi:hypothetical protein XS16_004669 [Salmonella enterica subsp. enterica serovar Newport]|nr:hypothetical protein [Salmonella enterica]EDT3088230.1 hypothetical protein [Salmonella enterica subsp. enterica serovar Newport]
MKLASTASTCLSVTKAESVYSGRVCRYGEVIFTGIFSQLALPTSIHRLTGVIDVKTTMDH